jgi:O-antigen/teichoic acid export membrane protein
MKLCNPHEEGISLIFVKIIPLAGIRQLANQTIWFGLSSIVGRFINYLLNPILTGIYAAVAFGEISILYSAASFLNIIFTIGMETSYFRFSREHDGKKVFNSTFLILILSSLLMSAILIYFRNPIAAFLELENHPEYVVYMVLIVALDTLAVIPFSKLRHEGRPRKFALIKLVNILINVGLVIFFLYFCKGSYESGQQNWLSKLYLPSIDIGYVFISQLVACLITLILLSSEWLSFRLQPDRKFMKEIFLYSLPLIIVGFGGMINETIDRFLLLKRYPGSIHDMKSAVGIYSANYKLAALIVIFIQTFRMGAEPFFFKHAAAENAKENYARIMNLFVIACCGCFLGVSLFPDIWKHFMGVKKHPEYLNGLFLVPILMLSKIFLGIYYNLSIWYKLTDKTRTGAIITIGGALVTIVVNYFLIPHLGYLACALATLSCYGSMMLVSYLLGQKHFPVPYNWKRAMGYILLAGVLFLIHNAIRQQFHQTMILHAIAAFMILLYAIFVLKREREELIKVPYLNRIYRLV